MKTEVDVPNATLVLIPGMYAEVDLATEQRNNVLSVPVEAVDGSGDSARVYHCPAFRDHPDGSGPSRHRNRAADRDSIRRVKEGDDVVIGSRSGLKDGIKVQPK